MRRRVLVVEDNQDNRDLLAQVLEDDYDVAFAVDGVDALEKIDSLPFDIVLLDVSIPKIDGLEVARRIRAQERFARLPLVAVTAHAMRGDRERVLAAGCDDHVMKPVDDALLLATMKRLLAGPS